MGRPRKEDYAKLAAAAEEHGIDWGEFAYLMALIKAPGPVRWKMLEATGGHFAGEGAAAAADPERRGFWNSAEGPARELRNWEQLGAYAFARGLGPREFVAMFGWMGGAEDLREEITAYAEKAIEKAARCQDGNIIDLAGARRTARDRMDRGASV